MGRRRLVIESPIRQYLSTAYDDHILFAYFEISFVFFDYIICKLFTIYIDWQVTVATTLVQSHKLTSHY
jgi:hypothetical protein